MISLSALQYYQPNHLLPLKLLNLLMGVAVVLVPIITSLESTFDQSDYCDTSIVSAPGVYFEYDISILEHYD